MTALATDPDLTALLTACRSPAGRDCDTTHLVLADRLDDLERGEWGELVRVSVELGRDYPGYVKSGTPKVGMVSGNDELLEDHLKHYNALRSRQRELEIRLRLGGVCGRCGGKGTLRGLRPKDALPSGPPDFGFWVCPSCCDGHTGTLCKRVETNYDDASDSYRSTKWSIPVVWSRGLPVRITAPLASLYDVAADRPSEWAISVQREWCGAVGEMVAGDQEPYEFADLWWIPLFDEEPHAQQLWVRLGSYSATGRHNRSTPELATRDFGRAIADLAREG